MINDLDVKKEIAELRKELAAVAKEVRLLKIYRTNCKRALKPQLKPSNQNKKI